MSFSSLYISGKYASHTQHKIFQAIKPLIDFGALLDAGTLSAMKKNISRRSGNKFLSVTASDVDSILQPLQVLLSKNSDIENLKQEKSQMREDFKTATNPDKVSIMQITSRIDEVRHEAFALEDQVMPVILNLPNNLSDDVPETDTIAREANMDLIDRHRPFKQLDYRQLSYINESVFASLVGPESLYETGRMARIRYSIIEKFSDYIRQNGFSEFSGMDFTKSAVVEAVRVKRDCDYERNPYRIDHGGEGGSQPIHLSGESSLESFCAYASKVAWKHGKSMRFFAAGSEYGSTENGPVQSHSIRTYSLLNDCDDVRKEEERLINVAWNLYPGFGVPVRGVAVSAGNLMPNEASRFDILVYYPIRKEWKRVASVSNYSDFVPRRLGIETRQLVSCVIVDSRILTQSIVEINQTADGSFIVPEGLDVFE